jgi:hypothetical protein
VAGAEHLRLRAPGVGMSGQLTGNGKMPGLNSGRKVCDLVWCGWR